MEDLKAIHVVEGTKVSHNYEGKDINLYSYKHLINIKVPSIGIPAKQNSLVIVDVDAAGDTHKFDGRLWWSEFSKEAGIPETYTVETPTGGAHYYFRLPIAINPDQFSPPANLAEGVDIKYNGWVKAPPTEGYVPVGSPMDIVDAPPSLIAEMQKIREGQPVKGMNPSGPYDLSGLHTPFTKTQLRELTKRIEWLQENGSLDYSEWLNGLFALKAGVEDPEVLEDLVHKWTFNKSYQAGDEIKAAAIIERADSHGPVGPGTIISILKKVALREGAPVVTSAYTPQEIIDKAKVRITITNEGVAKIAPSESNVASLIGAMFDSSVLFHDIRMDNFVFKGQVYSDQELANIIAPMIQSPVYGLGFENIRKVTIVGGLDVLLSSRQVDPHKAWLESLEWDGIPRIDTFFSEYCSAKDNDYTRAVSRNIWLAMAARGIKPGSKFDYIVILEGAEGARKSTLCELLGGEYYMCLASKEDINSPETLRKMHQSTVVELPELVGLLGRSGEEIKAVLAARHDNIRALYARKGVRRPRGFVFFGTTNSGKYLKEDMGTRRYWPIKVEATLSATIDTKRIETERAQLFAEAVARFKLGEEFWEVPHGNREVMDRQKEEPLADAVRDIISNAFAPMKLTEVYKHLEAGSLVSRGLTTVVAHRITYALKTAGARRDTTGRWELPSGAEAFL